MSARREVSEGESDGRTEVRVSEAADWWTLIRQALRSTGWYGGITAGAGLALIVIAGLAGTPKTSLARSWDYFEAAVTESVPVLLTFFVPLVVLVGLLAFGVSLWRQRRLTTGYRVDVEEGELRVFERGVFGERPVLSESAETVLTFQSDPLSESNLEEVLDVDASHEVTVMTDDGMYTFGEGLEEREAERVVERLETTVFGSDVGD